MKSKKEFYKSVEDKLYMSSSDDIVLQAMQEYSDQQLSEYKEKLKEEIEKENGILTKGLILLTIDTTLP